MSVPRLNTDQQDHFDKLYLELRDFPPEQRRARLREIAAGDRDLAIVLRGALGEPPSLRSLEQGDVLEATETSRYQLVERLSAGGFGEVWRASQALVGGHDRDIALKFILPHHLLEGAATAQRHLRMFYQEIARLARFHHPHIVPLFAAAEVPFGSGGLKAPCYVMQYVEGDKLCPTPHLKDRTARLECFLKICDAVAYSHQHNLVHLDLKPDNIRVRPNGEPVLIDFGLAEELLPDRPFMPWLVGAGTLHYMAPEQIRDEGVSPETTYRERGRIGKATDVHALGLILFQMLTDQLPYDVLQSTDEELRRLICEGERIPLTTLRTDEDPRLEEILAKALSRKPEKRHADAGAFRDALKSWLARKDAPATAPVAAGPSVVVNAKNVKIDTGPVHQQNNTFS